MLCEIFLIRYTRDFINCKVKNHPMAIYEQALNAGRSTQCCPGMEESTAHITITECGEWVGPLAGAALGVPLSTLIRLNQILFDIDQAAAHVL